MIPPVRFKNFIFYIERGELVRNDKAGADSIVRLGPQPSKLLGLLLLKYPNTLSHQEIRNQLWTDVQVGYDRSTHFCISQIRSALNDSGSDPLFIQTIPRRGYRWMIPYTELSSKLENDGPPEISSRVLKNSTEGEAKLKSFHFFHAPRRKIIAVFVAIIAITCLGFIFFQNKSNHPPSSTESINLKVAVMPFQPRNTKDGLWGNEIAFKLVEILTNDAGKIFDVIGPTTTSSYQSDGLKMLINDFDIDFIINGRIPQSNENGEMLVEIIRASDRAHVWVRYFTPTNDAAKIAKEINEGLKSQVEGL